jgi:hypothetical protein
MTEFLRCRGFEVKIASKLFANCCGINNNNMNIKAEYCLRESVLAQGREGRGFDSDPERNLKKKAIFYLVIRKSR